MLATCRLSAPTYTWAFPVSGEALSDQGFTERSVLPQDDAQLPPITILVAIASDKRERSGIEQLEQPLPRDFARSALGLTGGLGDLRRVDIGDADLGSLEPERIPIDDAGDPLARPA